MHDQKIKDKIRLQKCTCMCTIQQIFSFKQIQRQVLRKIKILFERSIDRFFSSTSYPYFIISFSLIAQSRYV